LHFLTQEHESDLATTKMTHLLINVRATLINQSNKIEPDMK